ncbi:hypothetical protein TeGR_g12798, partial [Tetraparma gracilis]
TQNVYICEDGSGTIKAQFWLNDEDAGIRAELAMIQPMTYVRVTGKVNSFNGDVSVTAHSIRILSDVNELSYHMAEVMYAHERAMGNVGSAGKVAAAASNGVGFGAQMGPGASMGQSLTAGAGGDASTEETEQGVSIMDIITALGKTHSETALRAAVTALSSDGMIYSTIDEDTFKYAL